MVMRRKMFDAISGLVTLLFVIFIVIGFIEGVVAKSNSGSKSSDETIAPETVTETTEVTTVYSYQPSTTQTTSIFYEETSETTLSDSENGDNVDGNADDNGL